MNNKKYFLTSAVLSLFLFSCNIYKPFAGKSSAEDIVDAARQCLHDGDFDCAIENYNLLPDGDFKSEKLCLTQIAKAGTTIHALTAVMNEGSASMLGKLADTMVPWTATKGANMEAARDYCITYADNAPTTNADTKKLLKMLALTSDCAMRMARTDLFQGDDATDTVCDTAGNASGTVTSIDIGGDGTGTLGVATPGMCEADVVECSTDVKNLPNDTELTGAGLSGFAEAFRSLPAGLTGVNPNETYRTSLKTTVTP